MSENFKRCKQYLLGTVACVCLGFIAAAQGAENIAIDQARGTDQRVVYATLTKFGPWDDRNYALTAADLKLLAPNEHELHPQIPAFFRVELRREWPHLKRSGPAQYPRAARQLFEIRYGGLKQNGKIAVDRRKQAKVPVPVNGEVQLNALLGANEVTVEINPSNPQQVIAGSNNAGGQEMYYSTDGGSTFTIQGVLPNTCCDPTVDWSSDGGVAYAASLSGTIGVSAWRSFNGGQTWVDRVDLTSSGSDKEFIHVDKSSTSPHQDNVYLTYHNGNTMQFARSTNMGASYGIQAFPGAPSGIGSDITTDTAGNIYYFYGAPNTQQIVMLKSVDGGVSFAPALPIAATNAAFDFPIPSIESRRAWIYTATDADRTGGPFDGSVYVSWTDTTNPESGTASQNHTSIHVAYSRDGGATWAQSTPHSTLDMLTVDRWNQWLTVDGNGTVHVVFYDTRNSVGRSGVDLYYTFSTDGGVTWNPPERISSQTSANLTDGQEFGDYNGISVVGTKIIPTWTDNRDGPPNTKDVYAADVSNVTAAPGFTLSGSPTSHSICTPGNLDDISIQVGSMLGFVNPVTLSASGLPSGSVETFTSNPVTPPNASTAQIFFGAVVSGDYSFDINGSSTGASDKSLAVNVAAFGATPGAATLLTPPDAASIPSISPTLSWAPVSGAASYVVEVDDNPGFGSIDFSTTIEATSATPTLATGTTYYWRVRAINPCGQSLNSATFSFTTGTALCRTGFGAIPDNGSTSDTLVVTDSAEISDLNVSLSVTHTWVGDLSFTLVHVDSGTSVTMVDRPGVPASSFGCSGNNIDTLLDDEGAALIETICGAADPAIGGNLIPNNALSAFDGEDLSGSWRLDITDHVSQDAGTLDEWCLLPETVATGVDSDGDGVLDDDDNCTLVPNPTQCDGDGDNYGNHCDGDFNGDLIVNGLDVGPLRVGFGTADPVTDLNCDGITNGLDVGPFKSMFGSAPGPSGLAP